MEEFIEVKETPEQIRSDIENMESFIEDRKKDLAEAELRSKRGWSE